MKQRMAFSSELNDQCMALLTTGKADIEKLKTQVQQNNTQQLHRVTTSLWIARAYLAEQNRREAETLLEKIVKLAPDLYPGKEAARLLGFSARQACRRIIRFPPRATRRFFYILLHFQTQSDASLPHTEYLVEKSLQKNAFFCKKGVAFSAEP